jgi:uncharacterized protein (TIGR02271 family)
MRSIVVVGTFDTRADAEQVAQLLMERGIDRSDIDIRSTGAADTGTSTSRESTSWWDWLFGESEQRSYYSDRVRGGNAVLAVTADDEGQAHRVRHLMEAEGGDVATDRETGAAPRPHATERREAVSGATGDEAVLPVTEERLRVGTRPVARGGVRVYRRMSERPVEEQVRLREEHVNVERRAVDRPAGDASEAFRDRVIEITEMAEELVVAKEVRVVEEVVVSKDVRERDEAVTDRVRRSDVEVERMESSDDEEFRRHWGERGRSGGLAYEQYVPAYQFGRQLGRDAGAGGEWSVIEPDARRRWEERNPGTWERFKEAIRYAWEGGRGGHRRAA